MKLRITAWIVCGVLALSIGAAQNAPKPAAQRKLPPLNKRASPQAVVDEHLDALNRCDWTRLIAQYPPEAEFFLPGGQLIKGREQVAELFAALVKPFNQGGLCGAKFETVHAFPVAGTLNVQWKATASFLKEPYHGADAYVTKDGLMYATVTTFQKDQLKTK